MTIQKMYNALSKLIGRIFKMVQRFSIALGAIFVPVGFAMITASCVNGIVDPLLIRILGLIIGLLGFIALTIAYRKAVEEDKNTKDKDKITHLITKIDTLTSKITKLITEIKKDRKIKK